MTEQNSDPGSPPQAEPEPLKLDVPVYDYVEHGADQEGFETRDIKAGGKNE